MSRLRMSREGRWALLAGALLASPGAHAEGSLHGQVSVLAADGRLDGGVFGPRLNLGLSARSRPEARGWWVGADVSLLVTPSLQVSDNSSALLVGYRPWSWSEGEEVALSVYPLSASRVRLGWAYPVTWAGRPSGLEPGKGGVQALKLGVERQRWSAFVAVKSTAAVNPLTNEEERWASPLAGASVAVLPALRVEVQCALLDRGLLPGLAERGVDAPAQAFGLSARLAYQVGAPIGTSVDFGLYRTAPELYEEFLRPQADAPGFSSSISLEATRVLQTLQDPDSAWDAARTDAGDALALQVRVRRDALRLHLLAHGRTVPFVLLATAGFPPGRALPAGTEQSAERALTLGADYHLASLGLTPGLVLRAGLPAAFLGPSFLGGNVPQQPGSRWAVFGEPLTGVTQYVVLPTGVAPGAVLTARASLKWDVVQQVAAVGELAYTRDPNRVGYRDDTTGVAVPVQLPADVFGFNVLLQLRL